jgi:hypothetical protein
MFQPTHNYGGKAMNVKEVTVLVSKKVTRDFQSWTVSHGVTVELVESESYQDSLRTLRKQLVHLVNEGLNRKNNGSLITAVPGNGSSTTGNKLQLPPLIARC